MMTTLVLVVAAAFVFCQLAGPVSRAEEKALEQEDKRQNMYCPPFCEDEEAKAIERREEAAENNYIEEKALEQNQEEKRQWRPVCPPLCEDEEDKEKDRREEAEENNNIEESMSWAPWAAWAEWNQQQ